MLRINNSIKRMVDEYYNEEEKERVNRLIENEFNIGVITYEILSIGLGSNLRDLSIPEIRYFYNYPSWQINQVDKLIACVIMSLNEADNRVKDEYYRIVIDNTVSTIDYLATEVIKARHQ